MTRFQTREEEWRAADRVTLDLLPECPNCHEYSPFGATVCECGSRLTLAAHELPAPRRRVGPHGCTCSGNGICTACVLASYEGEEVA